MTLLIDATTAEHARGIRTVTLGILGELPYLVGEAPLVVAGPGLTLAEEQPIRRVAIARTRPGRLLYQRVLLPLDASRLGISGMNIDRILLLDSYAPLVPAPRRIRYAALVHDILPLTHPQFWPLAKRLVKQSAFSSLRRARATIFTSTEHNAREITRILGMAARVVRFGCGQLSDLEADEARASPLPEREPYLLYVGALEPRKNVLSLIDVFDLAPSMGNDFRLRLVGDGNPAYVAAVEARVAASPHPERIEIVSRAPRDAVLNLLRHATALVHPPLAEGFALPVLEALALGTPVVTTSIDSIRAWAGDSVLYAGSSRPGEWRDAIAAAAACGVDHRRSGQALAADYRWRVCAEEIVRF